MRISPLLAEGSSLMRFGCIKGARDGLPLHGDAAELHHQPIHRAELGNMHRGPPRSAAATRPPGLGRQR